MLCEFSRLLLHAFFNRKEEAKEAQRTAKASGHYSKQHYNYILIAINAVL
jgi:hypothetical protein